MANYQSTLDNQPEYVSPINLGLLSTVMNTRQQRYDLNLAKSDAALAELKAKENLLIRPEDKEYFSNSVQSLLDTVNASGKIDWTNNGVARQINSHIGKVLGDDYIIEQIGNSQKIRNFYSEVEALKQKDPKLYNDANFGYAIYKGKLQDYMSKKTETVGNLNYIPYTDVSEEYLKKIKTISDLKGKRSVEETVNEKGEKDPNGKFKITKSIEGLTEQEIEDYMGSIMTSQELQQIKINGWQKFGQDEAQAKAIYSDYNAKRLENTNKNIEARKTESENPNLSPELQQEAKNRLAVLEETKATIENTIKNQDKVEVDTIGFELEKANYLNGLSKIASAEWSYKTELSEVYEFDRNLEIKAEELRMKKAEAQSKSGLDANGQPITEGVVSVSAAEVTEDQLEASKGGDSLQKRHDGYFTDIIDAGKSILTSGKVDAEDKKVFEAELKKRGLDKNLQWIDKDKSREHSRALETKAAFDAAKLGATYRDEAQTMSNALNKKLNISKDLINTETQSYTETFNKDPDKYIDFLNIAESQLKVNPYDAFNTMNPLSATITDISPKIKSLVKEAGGWKNMKNFLTKNPNKLREFAELTDKADRAYKGVASYQYDDQNLKEDAHKRTEELLQEGSKSGAISSFTDYNTINFVDENVNSKIIKSMTQTNINGEGFDPKQAMTVRMTTKDSYGKDLPAGSIEIIQHKGERTAKGAFTGNKISSIVIDKGDAAYQIAMQYVNAKEEEQMGFSADKTTTNLPSSRPNVLDTKTSNRAKNIGYNIEQVVNSNPNLKQLFTTVDGNPAHYTTKENIKKVFDVKLSDYPKETVEAFTNEYLSKISTFSITPHTSKLFGDNKWSVTIKDGKGEPVKGGEDMSLNVKNLDKDTYWLIENAPQTFITEFFLRQILEDKTKTKINTILK